MELGGWWRGTFTVSGLLVCGCSHFGPPALADPTLLGCYRLDGNLPAAYSDSLGYVIPGLFRLADWTNGQWVVLPTDFEHHPYWTRYDMLPSGYVDRQRRDPPYEIGGDSIDLHFPGYVGKLALRFGRVGDELRGRAEWITLGRVGHTDPLVHVTASRASCEGLPRELSRVR